MGWATRWEPQGVCTTALARIAAATAMAGNTRQTRSGLRLWRGERWRTKNRIGGTVTSLLDNGRMMPGERSGGVPNRASSRPERSVVTGMKVLVAPLNERVGICQPKLFG